MNKFAVVLTPKSRFAPHIVGEFVFNPEYERHIFQGKTASTLSELADQVNAAVKSVLEFRDPFIGFEVVEVEKGAEPKPQTKLNAVGTVLNPVGATIGQTHSEELVGG